MATFYMMVGIPGSGKSTWAKNHQKELNYEILSSDDLRVELFNDVNFQGDNAQVFNVLAKRTLEKLKSGINVCYDATNINIKSRKGILSKVNDLKDVSKVAIVFRTSINDCLKNNSSRERKVPENVIYSFVSRFEIPFKGEGFDHIILQGEDSVDSISYFEAYESMTGFDQKNPHHTKDLKSHCDACQDYVLKQNEIFDVVPELAMAALLHDYGKLFTASWDSNKKCNHYYNHENVGAYILFSEIRFPLWVNLYDIVFYVNYHMMPYKMKKMSESKRHQYEKSFSADSFMWKSLQILHDGDLAAH